MDRRIADEVSSILCLLQRKSCLPCFQNETVNSELCPHLPKVAADYPLCPHLIKPRNNKVEER